MYMHAYMLVLVHTVQAQARELPSRGVAGQGGADSPQCSRLGGMQAKLMFRLGNMRRAFTLAAHTRLDGTGHVGGGLVQLGARQRGARGGGAAALGLPAASVDGG